MVTVRSDERPADWYVREIKQLQGESYKAEDVRTLRLALSNFMQIVMGHIKDHEENKHP